MGRFNMLVGLALVVMAMSLTCKCEEVSRKDYLNFPTDLSSEFHKNVAAALEKLVLKDAFRQNFWWETLTDLIEKASKETNNPIDRQVYTDLVQLQLGDFSGRAMDTFLSICAQADHLRRTVSSSVQKPVTIWKTYLQKIAKDALYFRLRSVLKYGRRDFNPKPEVVKELNAVFAAAFGMQGDLRLQSVDLATKLSGFDLAEDESFDAGQMLGAIRKISKDASTKDNFELLQKFMLERCQQLMDYGLLRRLITAKDVLRYLESSEVAEDGPFSSPSLKLVDEYNRLCLALKRPYTSSLIRINLNDRLQHQ